MSYQLVIAEKPSVARSIAGVIGADKKQDGYMEGNGYLVSWCIGHLVSLADAGTYDERFKKWRYDDLPILPQEWQYIIPDDKILGHTVDWCSYMLSLASTTNAASFLTVRDIPPSSVLISTSSGLSYDEPFITL